MSWLEEERYRLLTSGLIGPRHAELYARSPAFKGSVDTLAQLLPHMVNGLAEHSVRQDELIEQRIAAMKAAPFKMVWTADQIRDLAEEEE